MLRAYHLGEVSMFPASHTVKYIALGLGLIVIAMAAHSAEWQLVEGGSRLTVHVDVQSIHSEGGWVKAWFRWNYAETQYTNPNREPFRSAKELNYFDCAKRTYAIAQSVAYAERDGRGESPYRATVPFSHNDNDGGSMRFEAFSFGSIRINGVTYNHDVVIDRDHVRKRKKKPSKEFREAFGHTPLSIKEDIPWKCRRLVIGTGTGNLPVMDEVKREAKRRGIKLVILPTSEAILELKEHPDRANAVLHVTC
jgi:hypothetical protein